MGSALRHILLIGFCFLLPLSGKQASSNTFAAAKRTVALYSFSEADESSEIKAQGPIFSKRKFKAKGTEVFAAQVNPLLIFQRDHATYYHAFTSGLVYLTPDYSYNKRGPPVHA